MTVQSDRVRELLAMFGLSSQREAADFFGCSQPSISRWSHGGQPDVSVAIRTGVSYDWLVGLSSQVWGERVLDIRRAVRRFAATIDATTPSRRFRRIASWVQHTYEDLVTDAYMAAWLHVDRIEYLDYMATVDVPNELIKRLAEYVDIPFEWFVTGDERYVKGDGYDEIIARLKRMGVSPQQAERILDGYEAMTFSRLM